jgi:hypothetical protein
MGKPMGSPLILREVKVKDRLEISTQGYGKRARSMAKGSNAGLMAQSLKDITKMIRNTAKVPYTWLIARNTLVSSGKESLKDLALIFGPTENNIKANGLTAKWKDLESSHGLMESSTQVNFLKTDSMDKASTNMTMAEFTSVAGMKESRMEMESL